MSTHADYPVCLRLRGKRILLVGGGRIAEARAQQLLDAGADLQVITPEASPILTGFAREGRLRLKERAYAPGDLAGHHAVLVATNDRSVSQAVAAEARALGIWINAADEPDLCDFTLPSVGRRGLITVAVSTAGNAPALAARLQRELLAFVSNDHLRRARLSAWIRRSFPRGAGRSRLLHRIADPTRPDSNPGRVFIVGAGPGDPGLLTLRAARVLAIADTIVHDRLLHPDILLHARRGARLIYAGKEGGGASVSQEEINQLLIDQARLGRTVVRLKGGDPFVFGRGGEEALALHAARVPFEVVPGVSSGVAAPAAAGIPVTHRGVAGAVTFATAHRAEGAPDWAHLARAETLVLFMAGARLAEATQALQAAGRSAETPAAVVEAGTWKHQRVVEGTLSTIALRASQASVGSPALLVVGEVVALRQQLAPLQPQPQLQPQLQRKAEPS